MDFFSITVCPAGNFIDSANGNVCSPCAIGTYSTTADATSCDACPSGESTSALGASLATECCMYQNYHYYEMNVTFFIKKPF